MSGQIDPAASNSTRVDVGDVILSLAADGLSCARISKCLAADHGVAMTRQAVHKVLKSLGAQTNPKLSADAVEQIAGDLVYQHRVLGWTLERVQEYVKEKTGRALSRWTVSRIVESGENMLAKLPLSQILATTDPGKKSVALEFCMDEILELRRQRFTLQRICDVLKEYRGISVEPKYLANVLSRHAKSVGIVQTAEGGKRRASRAQLSADELAREQEVIDKLRARREQFEVFVARAQLAFKPSSTPAPVHPTRPQFTPPSTTAPVSVATDPVIAAPMIDEVVGHEGVKNESVDSGSVNGTSGSDAAVKKPANRKPFSAKNFNTSDQVDPTLAGAFDKFKPAI